ncbi:MAG: AAA family ATPase [Bacteroidota bacterium]
MSTHRILLVTGASGAGKTTLAEALAARTLAGVGVHHADREGVPSASEMTAQAGSPEAWQRQALGAWVDRLVANASGHRVSVLESQFRPHEALQALAQRGADGRVILIDCAHAERNARLAARGQPGLATAQMNQWAAYLKGQADALDLTVIDTTDRSVEASADALDAEVRALLGG